MQYRILGKTGLKVSAVGFGGIPIQRISLCSFPFHETSTHPLFDVYPGLVTFLKVQVLHFFPPNPIFTICMFIIPSPTRARRRKKPLTDGSFRSL